MATITRGKCRLGIPPEVREILDLIESPDSTTGLDINGNLILYADNRYIAFGAAGVTDSSIYFDGTDLTLKDSNTGTKTLAQLAAGTTTLDQAFDNGKLIDGSTATGAANAFSVGGAAADDKIEIYHTGTEAHINARADNLYITAAGGGIDFDNETLTTTNTITCQGITNTATAIDTTANIQIGADDVKLTLGVDDATDSYLQFGGTDLEIFSAGGISFWASGDVDDYISFTTTAHVPSIVTAGSCNLTIAPDGGTTNITGILAVSSTLSAATNSTIGNLTLANGSITDSSGDISFGDENLTTTGNINIDSDTNKLTLGDSGSTDSYIYFDGTSLTFYDSDHGSTVTLKTLAGGGLSDPDITGNLTITNGKFNWTYNTDAVAATWTFAGITNDSIDIVANSTTSANILHIVSTSLDSGSGICVELTEASVSGGYYFRCRDASAPSNVFTIGEDGATRISGGSGDMLTIIAGNFQMTDGNIDMDEGKLEIDSTADETSYVKRNNGTGSTVVFEIEQTHTDGGVALLIDQNANNTAADAVQITQAGAEYGVKVTAGATGSGGYEFVALQAGTAPAFFADGDTGTGWVGAAATGLIQAQADGALADVAASLLYLDYAGDAGGANQTGSCINVVETGAASGTSYTVGISSTNNNALHLTHVTGTTTTQLTIDGPTAQTASMVILDGTTGAGGWIGAAATGMLHLKQDGGTMAAADTSMVYIDFDGTHDTNQLGTCLLIDDDGTADGTNYSVYVNSNAVNGVLIRTAAATMTGLVVDGPANQTASMVLIDGSVGTWLGADGVGMLQLDNDGAFAHVNSSMLLITNTGVPQDDSRGHCLRIVDTGNAAAGTAAYAAYISATDPTVEALYVDDGIINLDEEMHINETSAGAGYGHIKIGTTADHAGAKGENVITIKNGAAKPAGAIADAASMYAEAGEMEVIDSGGAETTLSPHSIEGDYMINSYDPMKGYTFRCHLELLCEWLVEKFPELASYVEHIEGRAELRPRQSNSPEKVKVA